jgi:hypothetical protein
MSDLPAHLASLEAEAVEMLPEGVAEGRHPALLDSDGKDSIAPAQLALRVFALRKRRCCIPNQPGRSLTSWRSAMPLSGNVAFVRAGMQARWTGRSRSMHSNMAMSTSR